MRHEDLIEQVEKAHDPFEKRVASTMAITAAMLAICSVLGHSTTAVEIVAQSKSVAAQVAYQGVIVREDLGSALPKGERKRSSAAVEEAEQIAERAGNAATRYEFSEVLFEVSLIFASLAILTKRKRIWHIAIIGCGAGLVVGILALAAFFS